ncbi:MAG: hypothetical protein IJ830_03990 [Alphaproteobacteria bacterium]|nr:hypothetical protein [Alphaproteobacteria bacterium]
MELTQKTARDMLAPLLENKKMLPRDIFDYKDEMHEDVSIAIRRCFPLVKKELTSFIKAPIKDIICYGSVCSGVHNSRSEIEIGFIIDTPLFDDVLKRIGYTFFSRGFAFKLYSHPLFFRVLKKNEVFGANWSLMYNKWNMKPVFQDFEFDLDFLMAKYTNLNNDFHAKLDNLPKNKDGFYTLESAQIIRDYFENIKQKARFALKNAPQGPYALDYILLKALDVMGVREHFLKEATKTECYYLSGAENGKV